MNTPIQSLIVAIGGAIAVKMNEVFLATLPVWLSVLLAAAVSAAFVLGSNGLFGWLRSHVPSFRRLVDPRAQFEGRWALKVHREDRPFSFAEIGFNRASRDHVYSGVAFDSSGEVTADWIASGMKFDLAASAINFVANVTIAHHSEDRQTHPTWGVLRFQRDPTSGILTTAHGTIVDLGTYVRKIEFLMERISEQEVEAVLGKKQIWTERDKAKLVQSHYS
jgi:hypothetical protein